MRRSSRSLSSGAFTLIEILIVTVILAIVVAVALPSYFRSVQRARSAEAVSNLGVIREAELAHQAQYGTFAEAIDLPAINAALDLELNSRTFEYEIVQADDSSFLAVATSRQSGPNASEPLRVSMDHTGKLTYSAPLGAGSGGGLGGGFGGGVGGGSRLTGGGGGGGGGRGGGGDSVGTGSGGGNSGGSPGTDTGSGGDQTGGDTGNGGGSSGGGGGGGGSPRSFAYIARGGDLWTSWPDVNSLNIGGTEGIGSLAAAFQLISGSGVHTITDDLMRKGISLSFVDAFTFQQACGTAIACLQFCNPTICTPPDKPGRLPDIIFNPSYLDESPTVLADVLVHEGTHFQQYLDGRISNPQLGLVDIEFDAFWNQAVFWSEVRGTIGTIDTQGEHDMDTVYQLAQQGEGALRNAIAAVYCGGQQNCEAGIAP